ncbi:MFS transporter [Streptomyces stramineus]
MSKERIALLFSVYGATASVAAWFSGALSDLWGPRRVMMLGLALWVVFQTVFLVFALPTVDFPSCCSGTGCAGSATRSSPTAS